MIDNLSPEPEILEQLFPFFFALDIDLNFVKKGKSLMKLIPEKTDFVQAFSFIRPQLGIKYTLESIVKFQERVFVLKVLGLTKQVSIKGQFIYDNGLLFFFGTPWIKSEEDFENTGLEFNDFSLSDWTADFLQLNKLLELELEDKLILKTEYEKQKSFYEHLFDYLPLDVAVLNDELKYVYINIKAVKDEETRKWLYGKTFLDYTILRNLDLAEAMEKESQFRKVLEDGRTYIYEDVYHKDTEHEKIMFRRMVPFKSADDKNFILASGMDITDLKKSANEILLKNEELKNINFELDSLIYSVTHDLRSPLNAITGLIEILEQENQNLEGSTLNYIFLIKTAIEKLDNAINEILDFTKNSRSEVTITEIELKELIQTCFDNIRHENKNKIKLRIEIFGKNQIYSDISRLRIILNALLSNAVIYSRFELEEPFIGISAITDEKNLIINIEDNGEGIAEEHKNKVFDIFYRASRKSTGSGQGLFICREIVKKLNGEISFKSTPAVGTIFTVKLPNIIQ